MLQGQGHCLALEHQRHERGGKQHGEHEQQGCACQSIHPPLPLALRLPSRATDSPNLPGMAEVHRNVGSKTLLRQHVLLHAAPAHEPLHLPTCLRVRGGGPSKGDLIRRHGREAPQGLLHSRPQIGAAHFGQLHIAAEAVCLGHHQADRFAFAVTRQHTGFANARALALCSDHGDFRCRPKPKLSQRPPDLAQTPCEPVQRHLRAQNELPPTCHRLSSCSGPSTRRVGSSDSVVHGVRVSGRALRSSQACRCHQRPSSACRTA